MATYNDATGRFSGICDNCGEHSKSLTKHTLTTREHNLAAGATVFDCPRCMTKYLPGRLVREAHYHAPDIRCSGCGLKAPVKYTKLAKCPTPFVPGNLLGMARQDGMLGDITGWMLIQFPTVDRRHPPSNLGEGQEVRVQGFTENEKLCPKCALVVKGTINHLKNPGVTEEDL